MNEYAKMVVVMAIAFAIGLLAVALSFIGIAIFALLK